MNTEITIIASIFLLLGGLAAFPFTLDYSNTSWMPRWILPGTSVPLRLSRTRNANNLLPPCPVCGSNVTAYLAGQEPVPNGNSRTVVRQYVTCASCLSGILYPVHASGIQRSV